jgi:hypothetical protein
VDRLRSLPSRIRRDPFLPIWPATAAIGQTLVVQQRGLDLSVPGTISVTTILITRIPTDDDAQLPLDILAVAATCLIAAASAASRSPGSASHPSSRRWASTHSSWASCCS